MIVLDSGKEFFYPHLINDNNYFSGFATKNAGNAQKKECIDQFFVKYQQPNSFIVIPNQVHGTNIRVITKKTSNTEFVESDGLLTSLNNVVLIAKTADCVPIIFVDKKTGLIGISHQGWKGTLAGMVMRMIEEMVRIGSKQKDIQVSIGPSIGGCCYSVAQERADLFREAYPVDNGYINERENTLYLNLLEANFKQLVRVGVEKAKIDYKISCTQCDSEKFFSYRREGKSFQNMFSFVVKRST